jgi:hypothetical protein
MTIWNFNFSYYVRLRNDLSLCRFLKIFFYNRINDFAHFDIQCRFLCQKLAKLYLFKIWTLSVQCDLDLWPKYFFPHCYSMDTNKIWKFVVMWFVVSEIPETKVLFTDIVKKPLKKNQVKNIRRKFFSS